MTAMGGLACRRCGGIDLAVIRITDATALERLELLSPIGRPLPMWIVRFECRSCRASWFVDGPRPGESIR